VAQVSWRTPHYAHREWQICMPTQRVVDRCPNNELQEKIILNLVTLSSAGQGRIYMRSKIFRNHQSGTAG